MANQNAIKDGNHTSSLIGESTVVPGEVARAKVNPANGSVLVQIAGASGGGGSGAVATQGADAAGVAATGSPVRTGAITRPNANKVTRTNGQVADTIVDENENAHVREAYAPVYEDNVAGVAKVEQRYTYASINTATTTVVKSGSGFLHQIRVLGGTLGAITIYDNTAASGTVIVPTITPTAQGLLIEDVVFSTGLTIVTAAATIITLSYR